nr:hypothetical protein [Tanacetum cinerariifolium]
MSAMSELNFLLGLQVLQKEDGIFLSQDKYTGDILKKFRYSDVRSSNTHMDKENPWGKDGTGKDVDIHLYRSMIGSLMYLTASRPDIMFPVCACARHQVTPKECHLLSMSCEALSKEISISILCLIHTAKTFDLVWIWLGGDLGNEFLLGYNGIQWVGTPTEPHHTPSPEANTSHPTTSLIPLPSLPTAPIPPVTQTDTTPIRQYSRRVRIAQSSALPTIADESACPVRDVSEGKACPTKSGFIANQDRATIAKSSTIPHDSTPRVTFPAADEGKILRLKERVQVLEDRESVAAKQSGDDAPIKGRSINEGEAAAKRISDDLEELARVLTSMDAATVLVGGIDVLTGSGSIPTAGLPAADISTGSEVVPTASLIVTSYSRRKGKEVMVESDTPKKQRSQEQIDAQIHVEEELQGMIDSLDRTNETIAKYIQEYQDFALELPLEKRIELISDLVKYQENYSKVYKFQSQQRRPMTKKQKKDYYMTMIRNNLGWKVKDFKAERLKRKGFNLEQEHVKKQKTSEEALEIEKSTEGILEEKMKEMMQLVPVEEVYVQALQVKHPIIDWKVELKRLYEPDPEDQLWTQTQNFMHAPIEWKLYDLCRVHQVTAKDKDIFMLVEKDYPLRKGLDIVMISYKLQVETYSRMANELVLKIYKIESTPRQQGD